MDAQIVVLSVENTRRNRAVLENSLLLVRFMRDWTVDEEDETININVYEHDARQFGQYLLDFGMNYRRH